MQTALFGSPLLETIICLILVYALLSLLVSTITEAINSYFKERGTLLYRTISRLFDDGININFGQLLYAHPMIKNLKKDNCSLPQYISAQMFSSTLIDVISNYAREYKSINNTIVLSEKQLPLFERFKAGINKMQHTELKLALLNMTEKCIAQTKNIESDVLPPNNEVDLLNEQLQQWFNDQMDRTSGWYKTYMRMRLFWVGLFVALILNIDSVHLFQTLYRSPDLRAQLEPIAEDLANNYAKQKADTTITSYQQQLNALAATRIKNDSVRVDTTLINNTSKIINNLYKLDSLTKNYDSARQVSLRAATQQIDQLASLGIPIGWKTQQAPLTWFNHYQPRDSSYFELHKLGTFSNIIVYLLGIIITAVSLSFGAPFWFDLLLKAVNLRRSGAKPPTQN